MLEVVDVLSSVASPRNVQGLLLLCPRINDLIYSDLSSRLSDTVMQI